MILDYSAAQLCSLCNGQLVNAHLFDEGKIKSVVIDTRNPSLSNQTLFIALSGGKQDGHIFLRDFIAKGGKVAIVSTSDQSLALCQIVVENPLDALQKIAKFHRAQFTYPVIGITGSNGKTIVKEWLYHVLKDKFSVVRSPKSYNSQIGVALSLLEMADHHNLAIIEAGISKKGEMEKLEAMIKPTIGIFTGIGDAHSLNFSSESEKKKEKYILFNHVEKLFDKSQPLASQIPFSDFASQINASFVEQVALHLQIDLSHIKQQLSSLPAVSMRLEQIEGKNNCLLLNDAYSADLQSLEIALQQMKSIQKHQKKILFLTPFEENLKEDVQSRLPNLISKEHISELVFIGDRHYLPSLSVPVNVYGSADEYILRGESFSDAVLLFKGSRKSGLEKIVQRLTERKHITQLVINFSALRNNLNYFRSRIQPTTKILVMVKAQSYGGGLIEMAHFLVAQKVDYFGVAYADEGVQLRKSGITLPILVMNPEQNAFDELVDFNLEPSIYSPEILESFIQFLVLKQQQHYPVHIKLDTGMNRLGFVEDQINTLVDSLQAQPEIYVKSVFSHLSVADDQAENQFTSNQIRQFDILSGQIADRLPYSFDRHLANSAGTSNFNRAEYNMVRLGIGIFGLVDKNNKALENVLSLMTRISQVKLVKKGESVGYGRTYIATRDQLIGIIPVGYADGLRRGLSQGHWSVLVNGKTAPIVGNICMDMCMIDLEGINAKTGDEVEVFGDHNSIFDMAMNLKTIPYEIIAGISSRVHRVYRDE